MEAANLVPFSVYRDLAHAFGKEHNVDSKLVNIFSFFFWWCLLRVVVGGNTIYLRGMYTYDTDIFSIYIYNYCI